MRKHTLAIAAMLALTTAAGAADAQKDERAEVSRIVCANPANATQKAICENEDLRRMDEEMQKVLDALMSRIPEEDERARGDIVHSQRRFSRVRRLCQGNLSCLKRVYASRLKTLREALAAR